MTLQLAEERRLRDGGATATIIAAIITSVTAAGTAAAGAAERSMRDSDNRGLVLGNSSSVGWDLWGSPRPFWGTWVNAPSIGVEPVDSPKALFDAWKLSGEAPKEVTYDTLDDLNEGELALFRRWVSTGITRNPDDLLENAEIRGNGGGIEGLAVYRSTDNEAAIAILIDHSPGSTTTSAGGIMTSYGEMNKMMTQSNWSSEIRNRIWDSRKKSVADTAWSDGGAVEIVSGDYTLTFQAGIYTLFTIRPASMRQGLEFDELERDVDPHRR